MALVPLRYNLRSLFVRSSATALTVCAIGATVAVLAGMLSLQQGFATLFQERGRADVAVFLRKGATSEGESGLTREQCDILTKEVPEVERNGNGAPLASAELFLAVRLRKFDGGETNVAIRGVEPLSFAVQGDDLRVVEGRRFEPGSDELIVGEGLLDRIANCRVGDVLRINTVTFRIVGTFAGKGGYRSVADIAERDAIPALRREAGMLVWVIDTQKVWRLNANLTTWTEVTAINEPQLLDGGNY